MKYIAMTVLALLALAGFSLGMFALFDSPVAISEKPPEPTIEFVELSNDKSCNREISKKIGKLMSQKHTCQSHNDCQLKLYNGAGCGNYIINNENALLVDELHEQKSTCINHMITSCMIVDDPYRYEAMCIDNYCTKAKMVNPETELKKFLKTGVMFR